MEKLETRQDGQRPNMDEMERKALIDVNLASDATDEQKLRYLFTYLDLILSYLVANREDEARACWDDMLDVFPITLAQEYTRKFYQQLRFLRALRGEDVINWSLLIDHLEHNVKDSLFEKLRKMSRARLMALLAASVFGVASTTVILNTQTVRSEISEWAEGVPVLSEFMQAMKVKEIWSQMKPSLEYLKGLKPKITELKEMEKSERRRYFLAHSEELVVQLAEIEDHADTLIDGAKELEKLGLKVNPGVVANARKQLEKIKRSYRLAHIATKYEAARRLSEKRWYVPDEIEDRAAQSKPLLAAAVQAYRKVAKVEAAIDSVVDSDLKTYTNNSLVDVFVEKARVEKGAKVEIISPVEISVGLRVGSRGAEVEALQRRLIRLGYLPKGADDGDFGGQTRKALEDFQGMEYIDPSGVVDEETKEALDNEVKKKR